MTSQYPGAIDGYSNIRKVRDTIDEVLAKDHNDNRDAIIQIERALGINPQGIYGVVGGGGTGLAGRLAAADADFATHISGTGHRHTTNHIDYPGSGSHTFADGYALIPARLGDTLDELVSLIGTTSPAGATGGDKVGTSPFWTPTPKYQFASDSVRGQQVEAGNYLDENATLLERALDAFVVDGMEVLDPYATGATARVAAGHIVSDGRLLRYDGGDLAVPASGTFYVFARISAGTVSVGIEDGTLPSLDPENPIVLLKKIVRSGGAWNNSLSTDIRRYGMLVNNKNFFSVGNTPSGGRDGYGCDFTSLKGAVDYIRALSAAGRMIAPLRVTLVDDIEISNDAELEIVLDVHGMEIDGCGNHITVTASTLNMSLFRIEANHIRIHDVEVVSNCTIPVLTFATLGTLSSVDNTHVINCQLETAPGKQPFDRFLRLGEPTGVLRVSSATISDNVAEVRYGGIVYETVDTGKDILQTSKICGNSIIQSPMAADGYWGIQAGSECVVFGNLVYGGFTAGIALHVPVDTVAADNIVTGTDGNSTHMTKGIAVYTGTSPTGDGYGALINGNIIKGIVNGGFGIDNKASACGALQSVIVGNIIDNSNITTPAYDAYGIQVYRCEVPVVGNRITWMGYPIYRAGFVVNNDIYGHGISAGEGVLCEFSAVSTIVCNNRLYDLNCDGSIININGSNQAIVSGNIIKECVATTASINMAGSIRAIVGNNILSHTTGSGCIGVDNIGNDSTVCSNIVVNHSVAAFRYYLAGADRLSFVGNRVYGCDGDGIQLENSQMCVVADNALIGGTNASNGIIGFASGSLVSGNLVVGYGYGNGKSIYAPCDYGPLSSAIVMGNIVYASHTSTQGGIWLTGSAPDRRWLDVVVANNLVVGTKGTGINLSGAAQVVVSGNVLCGIANSSNGIYRVGQYSVVANNIVFEYGNGLSGVGISLMDAYSSAVVGNTIAAYSDLTQGIYLDASVGTLDNLIANNVLNGLAHCGIDLNAGASGRHIVANNIIIGTGQSNGKPGIDNLSSQSLAIGNDIFLANGDGIHVTAGFLGYTLSSGSAVVGNMIADPDAYGIHVDHVGGLVRLDGYSDLNSCLVAGNHVTRSNDGFSGIYLVDSWRTTITGNFVKNFGVGIWLLGMLYGSIDNLVCGNNIHHDPIMAIGNTGILIDAGCTSNHVIGNFVYGSLFGIGLNSNLCSVVSNHIIWCRDVPSVTVGCGIEASGTIDCSIIGNYVGPAYLLSSMVDGINIAGCKRTLVVGNFAFADESLYLLGALAPPYGLGLSFRISSTATSSDVIVMSGNLGRLGANSPDDGSGGNWPTGGAIDDECCYDTTPI